jgi:transglutaminase-like putative cysteine protease
MRYLIEHDTRLTFASAVREHHCELRVAPRDGPEQRVVRMHVETAPAARLFGYTDCFGNLVHCFSVIAPHDVLVTRARAEVETCLENPFDYEPVPPAREPAWIAEALRAQPRLWDYVLHRSPATPALDPAALDLDLPPRDPARPLLESVQAATAWIRQHFDYDPDATHVHSTLAEVLEGRGGVCQDFAHLLVALVRWWGFPARYAVGCQERFSVEGEAGPEGAATHAWADVLIPGAGWRGFDPTNALLVDHTYVRVAVGRDYEDAAPQRGSFKGDDGSGPPEVRLRVARGQQ